MRVLTTFRPWPRPSPWWVALTALAATGCSPLALLNAVIPSGGYERTTDLPFGPHPRQRLDVYRPRAAVASAPVVVFFYGGRWRSGERGQYRFVAEALTSRGLVAVLADYRLSPEVTFPAFVEDGARAVAWARAHIAGYGGDPERILVAGHSAGAHIALLLALDRGYLSAVGAPPVAGAIGLAGPYDFLPFTSQDVREAMGPEAGWPDTQPIHFARAGAPPILLIHGLEDSTVRPGNSLRLAQKLREQGGCVRHLEYARTDHSDVLLALASPLRRSRPPVLDEVAEFIKRPGC